MDGERALTKEARGLFCGVLTTQAPNAQNMTAAGVTITVPAGKIWRMWNFMSDTITTAGAGNRILQVKVTNGTATMWIGIRSTAVTASQAGGYDVAFPALNSAASTSGRTRIDETASTNVMVRENCPIQYLGPGWKITLEDAADIAATDQVTLRLTYEELDA